ncbi:DEAD/DEAH box helicase [Streptomyces montanisoli]|uniref:DEAD/DEAH box helicase family protein n=1 Tax=Streptomyces montanisoli TaxID=2798581 RepID=A0A940RWQ0_9ACTN|nr:SNF2-related protein [Streptomyces montanisoli]MBP0459501.1 DEAD/DEAH box helicase family protein [Streptomyces montanisoli]
MVEHDDALFPGAAAKPAAPAQDGLFEHDPATAEDSFRSVTLKAMYSPDDAPFETFYEPLLSRAVAYDRAVGYWSGAELQFAAQGTAYFIAGGGVIRLIVGAQLSKKDVDAVLSGAPLDDVVAERLLADPGLEGTKIVQSEHLSVLAWMVANDRLHIRVGIPVDKYGHLLTHHESGRYFHTKYGIFTDRYGHEVAFSGSNNASVTAWVKNHETFDAYRSWRTESWEDYGAPKKRAFEQHWRANPDQGWAIIDLPTAVREHLIEHAPDAPPFPFNTPVPQVPQPRGAEAALEAPPADVDVDVQAAWDELVALRDAPKASAWTGVGTAWAQPLPHQAELIHRVVSTYPRGYLFADEVGLGKTVEAGMVLRELFTSGRAKKALLLVPASVMKQWQEELHEKMNIDVARYDKGGFIDRFDQPIATDPKANPWSAFPIVLASSHLARRRSRRTEILDAGPWDVVLVDEAHHARRRGSKATDTPNSLLVLLQEMKKRNLWRALYLASATPMQMHPHEAWDLIELLGLPGKWGEQAFFFTQYFTYLSDPPERRGWKLICDMLEDYFSDPLAERDTELERQIDNALGWADAWTVTGMAGNPPSPDLRAQFPNATSEWMAKWARRHTPMRDRVFRKTRKTMRAYQAAGIIPGSIVIPYRHVTDEFIRLAPNERKLYERIEEYIRRHYNAYKSDKATKALGFIMTVYRRRLTSSFEAIKQSLQRRLDVLEQGKSLADLLTDDDGVDLENSLFDPETFDVRADRLKEEIGELRSFLNDLGDITGEDTKAQQLVEDLAESFKTYDSAVVFTQYTDTMDYVRERLVAAGYYRLGCYSGRGGEIYDPVAGKWDRVTKAEIKTRFRRRDIELLIGTDSLSEGLNLQTSGRLINYDMPWNLMRVEQRIGRIDRIGATYEHLQISNYFYEDTVEEQVYKGIKDDYDDFTNILGAAAPVLGTVEKVIEDLVLAADLSAAAITREIADIRTRIDDISSQPVSTDTLGAPDDDVSVEPPPDLTGGITPSDLVTKLASNALSACRLTSDDGRPGIYRLILPRGPTRVSFGRSDGVTSPDCYLNQQFTASIPVTFDRNIWDTSNDRDLVFLTFGSPELDSLLPLPAEPGE